MASLACCLDHEPEFDRVGVCFLNLLHLKASQIFRHRTLLAMITAGVGLHVAQDSLSRKRPSRLTEKVE
jgi:hypothetical protein